MHVAILFEFGTLNGGEHSMLAVMERLARKPTDCGPWASQFTFTAIAPARGRLADALRERGVAHVPFSVRDVEMSGTGVPPVTESLDKQITGGTPEPLELKRRPAEAVRAELVELVKQLRPDLLHANSLSMGRLTGSLAERLAIPCVAHLRDIIGLSAAAVADLNRNRRLIAVSQATKAFHIAQGLDAGRVEVVYNGVDLERFQPRDKTGDLHRELGLSEDAYLIATVGQIGLRKGQDVLAEAAVSLGSRLPDVHWLLVGERLSAKAESVEFERRIVQRFEQAGVGARLHRLGYRADMPRLMNEVDLLVHPAKQEPLGRVLLEALASGLPVVATDVGGTREILEEGVCGSLVPANDPQAVFAAVVELHDHPQLAAHFATAGRRRAETMFNVERAAENLAAVWNRIAH
jgi:glycosyltransferase involved in cell wall biosynthesis